MIRYKKRILTILMVIVLGVWGYRVYFINHEYPNPENKGYEQGEITGYKGLQMTVGEVEVLDLEEFEKRYPQILEYYEDYPDERAYIQEDAIIVARTMLENLSEEDITMHYASVPYWTLEVGSQGNGVSLGEFIVLNPDYSDTIEAGKKMEVLLPYTILDDYMTKEEIENEDIKIVFSYYPTKSYMLYKSDERQGAD